MILNDDHALTYWTDNQDYEWEIKILFSYQPSKPMQTNPDHPMFGPGCDAGIVDMQVERREFTVLSNGTATGWVLFEGATDKEEADWSVEIMEAINQEFIDNMGEE